MESVDTKNDQNELRDMLTKHLQYTGSVKAKRILENFNEYLPKFKKIIPEDYKRMVHRTSQLEEQGMNYEQAQIEAFYVSTGSK